MWNLVGVQNEPGSFGINAFKIDKTLNSNMEPENGGLER